VSLNGSDSDFKARVDGLLGKKQDLEVKVIKAELTLPIKRTST